MKIIKTLLLIVWIIISFALLGPAGPVILFLLILYMRHCARYEEDKKLQREANQRVVGKEG